MGAFYQRGEFYLGFDERWGNWREEIIHFKKKVET